MFFYNELSEDVQQVYTSWLEANKLTASDKATDDRFGHSVAVSSDGSTIVVGAYLEDPDNRDGAGSAYVFTKTGDTWTQIQKIRATDRSIGDQFGKSVSVSDDGSVIVVGAPREDPYNTIDAGSVYIFTKTSSLWSQAQKIIASDKGSSDIFGSSVSVSGDGSTIVVAAEMEDPIGVSNAGSVYVFTKTDNTWTEVQKIRASDFSRDDFFGYSVAISGDGSTIVVGSHWEDPDSVGNAGSAYIFVKSGSTWTQVQKIPASDKASLDQFGWSVSVSDDGSTIVVGAPFEDPQGIDIAGSAYIFSKTGDTWTEAQKITASDKERNDYFGHSVAIAGDGSTIVVGAYREAAEGIGLAGSAYVFTKTGSTWTEVQKTTASDKEYGDQFGWSVSVSGDGSTIVVGAYYESPGGVTGAGSAYVFQGQ